MGWKKVIDEFLHGTLLFKTRVCLKYLLPLKLWRLNPCMFRWWWRVPWAGVFSIRLRRQPGNTKQTERVRCNVVLKGTVQEETKLKTKIIVQLTGTRSLFTSSMARFNLSLARFSVSSTDIKTWSSSLRCSQFGLPLFCSSLKAKFGNELQKTAKSTLSDSLLYLRVLYQKIPRTC